MSDKRTIRRRLLAALAALLVIAAAVEVGAVLQAHETKAASHRGLTTLDMTLADSTQNAPPDTIGAAFAGDPFVMMDRMQKQMDRMFDRMMAGMPSGSSLGMTPDAALPQGTLDVEDLGDRYQVKVELPGVDQAALSVSVEDDVLKIDGKREEITEETDADGNVTSSRRSYSQFSQAASLPGPVNADKMKTDFADGVLTIELPKKGGGTI